MTTYHEQYRISWLDHAELEAEFFAKLEVAAQRPLMDKLRSHIRASFIEVELVARRGPFNPERAAKKYSEISAMAENLSARLDSEWPRGSPPAEMDFECIAGRSPDELANALAGLVSGLRSEIGRINRAARRGRKRQKHVDTLIFQMAGVFADAGGKITIGGGPFTKFLSVVWDHLPRYARPITREAFIERAQGLLPNLKGRIRTFI